MKTALGLAASLIMTASIGLAAEEVSDVAFVLGPKQFSDGDTIIIEHVSCTSPNLAVGDHVLVRGRYTLSSEAKAKLCLFLTTSRDVGSEPVSPTQQTEVKKGSGSFELEETVKHPGHLHLGFYGGDGERLGTVYFGTEQQMKQISHWNLRD